MTLMNGSLPSATALAQQRLRPTSSGAQRWLASGFTLIELMTVVAIVAVLAGLSAPSLTTLLRSNRLASASSALQVSLSLARSEAVKRGSDARVTVAANGTAGTWTNGWTVFVDKTADAHLGVGPDADDSSTAGWTRLEVVAAPSAPISVQQTGALQYFSYNGQGRLVTATGSGVANRSFWFFDGNSEKYCLIVSNTGRVRTARVTNTGASADCSNS